MIVTPVPHGLDLLKSELVRSPGLHASQIYGELFQALEPERFKGTIDTVNPVLLALGTAWEAHLEKLLLLNGIHAERPEEFVSPEGIAFSPDLIIFNGVTRLGEIKYTSMSARDMPIAICHTLPPKLDKYLCVAPEVTLLTSDLRYIRADEVYPGLSVLGFDEFPNGGFKSKRHWRHSTILAVKSIRKPCSRIHLADGTSIVVSNDHQWYGKTSHHTPEQWLSTNGLLQTDKTWPGHPRRGNCYLSRVFPVRFPASKLTDAERGWLAGIADGEGCLFSEAPSGGLRLTLSQNPGCVFTEIDRLLLKDNYAVQCSSHKKCVSLTIGDKREVARFLATIRPLRLLKKFTELQLLPGLTYTEVQVESREDVGEQTVYAIETDTHTYLADGLASHNCQMKLYAYWLGLHDGWLAILFNYVSREPDFRVFELQWTDQELSDNHAMCINFARHKGLLP